MNDRELLEFAAKACSVSLQWPQDLGGADFLSPRETTDWQLWNPLKDDGDALRLAVKLRVNIEHIKTLGGDDFGVNCWPVGRGDCGVSEEGDLSDYAAITRRAIVRAAAEIGRQIQEGGAA